MMQEKALKITENLKDSSLDSFTASNGWLEKWKAAYGVWETRISGEGNDFSVPTMKSWIKRILVFVRGYKLEDIWNKEEFGTIF